MLVGSYECVMIRDSIGNIGNEFGNTECYDCKKICVYMFFFLFVRMIVLISWESMFEYGFERFVCK